jgi:hypothetical protein
VIKIPMCLWCKHFQKGRVPKCTAFPDGIPKLIYTSDVSHLKPYKNDNGVQFEAIPETPKEQLAFIQFHGNAR